MLPATQILATAMTSAKAGEKEHVSVLPRPDSACITGLVLLYDTAMSIPKQALIELPLLQVIKQLGGEARPRDVYPILAKEFPELTAADLAETLSGGANRWTNRVQWARQTLVSNDELDSPSWGVWRLTALAAH